MGTAVRRPDTRVRVHALAGGALRDRPDRVVTEEPMEIRVQGAGAPAAPLAVTMRTPGHDFELAVGLCRTEGVLRTGSDLAEVRYCLADDGADRVEQEYNVVTVALRAPVDLEPHRRALVASASCGLCGKVTLDQVEQECAPVAGGPVLAGSTIVGLPERLRAAQTVFDATGGLHAAGLFSPAGDALAVREDVGRHNAVDKLVGWAVLEDRLPLAGAALVVSGRVSFEIVQKAAVAGVPVIVAVSAPSSLAVAAAQRLGLTLVGFVRDGSANVYSHPARVDPSR
jgi:FdhD protein